MIFYNYTWKIDGVPEYEGKGCGDRFLTHLGGNSLWANHLKKAIKEGRKIECIITIAKNEEAAFATEVINIAKYGRRIDGTGTLYNILEGGLGSTGLRHTPASKAAIGVGTAERNRARKGTQAAKDQAQAGAAAMKVKGHTNEAKAAIGKAVKGEKNGFYGKKHTEETLKRIALTRKLNKINKRLQEIHKEHDYV